MLLTQHTLNKSIRFAGVGVHSGRPSSVLIHPAGVDTGLVFVNTVNQHQKIQVGTVIPDAAMHATVIKSEGWVLSTVEHLLAALSVMGVDNAIIEVEGLEIPILDGSALPFVQVILDAGTSKQSAQQKILTPREILTFADQQGRRLEIIPAKHNGGICESKLFFNYSADFKHPLVAPKVISGEITQDYFVHQVAPARTFGFLEQLPFLRQHNLARGTSLGNSVVIGEEFINEMRLPDECVRHKILDLIGDLSLLGKRLAGTVTAHQTSHNFNRLVIEHFIQHPDQWELI